MPFVGAHEMSNHFHLRRSWPKSLSLSSPWYSVCRTVYEPARRELVLDCDNATLSPPTVCVYDILFTKFSGSLTRGLVTDDSSLLTVRMLVEASPKLASD